LSFGAYPSDPTIFVGKVEQHELSCADFSLFGFKRCTDGDEGGFVMQSGAVISPEQSPGMRITMPFFFMAPLSALAAGVFMMTHGGTVFQSAWLPDTLVLVHLGTLGFLSTVMMGALYQLCPVLAGVPVRFPRLAQVVYLAFVFGLVAFLSGVLAGSRFRLELAMAGLVGGGVCFILPTALALGRARPNDSVRGMRLALFSFFVVVVLGTWMAHGFAGIGFPGDRATWTQVHLSLGLLGWVGGLLVAVSWRLIPMFYLTPEFREKRTHIALWVLGLSLLLTSLVPVLQWRGWMFGFSGVGLAGALSLPAALVVWVIHPILVRRALSRRRRKRVDPSKSYWVAALTIAPVVLVCALGRELDSDPRWSLAFGWLAIWGWAGLIVHGMLTRIVAFLVWFHRFSHRVGQRGVPNMNQICSPARAKRGLWIHTLSVFVGLMAILQGGEHMAQLSGLFVFLVGLHLLHWMSAALLYQVAES
jgi:hypothetical protein